MGELRRFIAFVSTSTTNDSLQATAQRTPAIIEPEFLSLSDAFERYRLRRGHLNRLIADGKVKSVSLRERGKVRGRRLIFHDSLRAYVLGHEVTPGESDA
jgi:hypothetical protein